MNPNTTRSTLLAVVGGYLIYLAYSLAKDLISQIPTDLPPALMIVVIALFTLSGIGIISMHGQNGGKENGPKRIKSRRIKQQQRMMKMTATDAIVY